MDSLKSATGRWVSGPDFFNRTRELALLETRIREGNHVLLTGQRRMGKTSIAQELGTRLRSDGWEFLFADVEDAETPQDLLAEIAEAGHPIKGLFKRFLSGLRNYLTDSIDEVSAYDFKIKVRAGLDAGTWKSRGETLFQSCAEHPKPVLLVIDELPIFLTRLLKQADKSKGREQVENVLGWFRRQFQTHSGGRLVFLISGSIGLEPLVRRLGLSDRINHLEPSFRVGPWDAATSVACIEALNRNYQLKLDSGVPERMVELLGIGIPSHVQSFYVRIREDAVMRGRDRISLADVDRLYNDRMLGPSGQADLPHYESRLREALDEQSLGLAMEITTEAAIAGVFGEAAKGCLIRQYQALLDNPISRVIDVLDVLVHDGYLRAVGTDYRFESNLLRDWWRARYEGHFQPLCERLHNEGEHEQ